MVATSLAKLSTIPKYEPAISEYVWFESHISECIQDKESKSEYIQDKEGKSEYIQDKEGKSECIQDKEGKVTTVSNGPFILDTYMETLEDMKKTLKLQMRLG